MIAQPIYNTVTFADVWDELSKFLTDLNASPFADSISSDNKDKLYYLLYARYGNNPIANNDVNQFKMKIYSVIFQYGPTWQKKLEIQEIFRKMTEEEITMQNRTIVNHAFNPSTEPGTSANVELSYIDNQQATSSKNGKLEGYGILMGVLDQNITEEFIDKFKYCFKIFVAPENPLLFINEEEQ